MIDTPRSVMLALACLTLLASCNSARKGAEAAVLESLKDPDSAKFGDFYFNEATKKGCMTVNARNSMGGYTGDQQAYLVLTGRTWEVLSISAETRSFCQEVHADHIAPKDTAGNQTSSAR